MGPAAIRVLALLPLAAASVEAQEALRIVVGAEHRGDPAIVHVPDLPAALDAVRARRQAERVSGAAPSRIEVLVSPGLHLQTRSAIVDAEAGGAPGAPTVILGHPDGARVVGAHRVPLDALRDDLPKGPAARLPTEAARAAVRYFDLGAAGMTQPGRIVPRGMGRAAAPAPTELFWNGAPLELARWPNTGFASVTEIVDPGSIPRNRSTDMVEAVPEQGPDRGGTFQLDDPRVERWVEAVGEAWMFGYWKWDWADELLPVARIDPVTRRITLGLPHHYGLDPAARFRAVNLLEELDRPGEYVLLEGRNAIVVWPPEDATDAPEILVTALADPLIHVRDAEHVEIRDLALGATRGPAIRVDDGAFVSIENCTIRGTGSHGIVLRGLRHRVSRCTITDTGAGGVTLDGGDRVTLTPGGHVVEDCDIARFGRLEHTYRPGVAISGVGHHVAHNRIHDAPHSAILVAGNEHVVELNDISRVLLETGDCGAIYMGRDWAMHGVVIRHNLIHDLPGTADRWQNAIYLDDMASGITVEGNVLLRCNLGMLIGGGRSLQIVHNVFVDCAKGMRFDARGIGWMSTHIADPSTSTLHQRLAMLPIDRPPWSERYPEVQDTLTVGFGRPVGSVVLGNAFFRTPFGQVDDPSSVTVEGNRSFDEELRPDASPSLDVRRIPGFAPIPIGDVGPRHAR